MIKMQLFVHFGPETGMVLLITFDRKDRGATNNVILTMFHQKDRHATNRRLKGNSDKIGHIWV